MPDYQYASVSGYVQIEGLGVFDATSINVGYMRNSIPTALAVIAVGTEVGTQKEGAAALADLARQRVAAQIYVTVEGTTGLGTLSKVNSIGASGDGAKKTLAGPKATSGSTQKIFDGYLSGVNMSRSPQSMGIQLQFTHWLDDLEGTSAFSDSRTPQAYYDYGQPSEMTLGVKQPGDGGVQTTLTGLLSLFKLEANADLGSPLMEFMKTLTSGNVLQGMQLTNATAARALERMSTDLILNFSAAVTDISDDVALTIVNTFIQTYQGGTLWRALYAFAGHFNVAILPTVDKVFLVPEACVSLYPALNIPTSEYVFVQLSDGVPRAIQAVVVFDAAGRDSSLSEELFAPLSVYYAAPDNAVGLIDAVQLPLWLCNTARGSTTQNVDGVLTVANAIRSRGDYQRFQTHGPTGLPAGSPSAAAVRNSQRQVVKDIALQYARLMYAQRTFGDCKAQIMGPLRTDIGPGTLISLGVPDIKGGEKMMFAYVESVNITVDCERALASTSMQIAYMRSTEDNTAHGTVGSPLYKSTPTGTNLGTSSLYPPSPKETQAKA